LKKSVAFVKEAGVDYMDLYGRALVDIAIALINGYLFCAQASSKVDMKVAVAGNGNGEMIDMRRRKAILARRYITKSASKTAFLAELICSGDRSSFKDYEILVGPVPEEL
jgi:hypothetical protein